jgi:hypothetical protein
MGHKFNVFIMLPFNIIYIHNYECLHIFVMCLLYITLLQFQIFIKKHLTLHYVIFCLKIHTKSYLGQYFVYTQANHDPINSRLLRWLKIMTSSLCLVDIL